jgi:hypothetical protein
MEKIEKRKTPFCAVFVFLANRLQATCPGRLGEAALPVPTVAEFALSN